MYYSHLLGEPRPQREPNELTGPVYKALHATRADLAPSLAPEWNFTLVDTTTNMENYDNHQQCWTILSHRNGGPTHINEIDILITTEKETSNFRFSAARYDYSKVFVFKDLRSPEGTGQEFGRFQCFYKDNQLITISSPDGGIFSPNNNGVFLNLVASTISSVFNLNRQIHRMKLIFKSGGNSHKIYLPDSNEPVATLDLWDDTDSWQLEFHESIYYTDREKFRNIILKAFEFFFSAHGN